MYSKDQSLHTLIKTCPLNKGLPGSNGTRRKEENKMKGDAGRLGSAGKECKQQG